MTDTDTVKKVAEAMARKREELIARPLASIWPDLASAAISEMQGWRPIEEAPKDGTQIIAPVGHGFMNVLSWSDGAWREGVNGLRLRKDPAHFMPLPLPPEGE